MRSLVFSLKARPALLIAVAAAAIAIPALGQDSPESLLPPGFGPPAPSRPAQPAPGVAQPPVVNPPAPPGGDDVVALTNLPPPPEVEDESYKLPPPVSRPINAVGSVGPGSTGFPANAFDGADGRYLTTLMQRLKAPGPSRWAAIVLRRALLSYVPTASNARPADWVAERAMLLTRMGDVDAARMLVQAVPVDRYTPRLYQVAVQVALASSDIGGLCPIADVGEGLSKDAVWPIARAMCAGLAGDTSLAAALIDRARQRRTLGRVDLILAERIATAGAGSQKSANVDWTSVARLNIYRYGVATASGMEIPLPLFRTAGPQALAWQARAPGASLERRVAAARTGAALGVISSANLVNLYSALFEETDPFAISGTPMDSLRKSYVEEDMSGRIAALETLWKGDARTRDGYAGRILTARAAARITPDADLASHAADLIGSMLSAGLDRQAARWWPILAEESESDAAEAWALLAIGAPGRVPVSESRVRVWADADESDRGRHRAALFVAALAGLGRLDGGAANELGARYGANLGARSRYLQRIDRAAAEGRGGEVALLASLGMQTSDWSGVPPQHLYHIIAALKRVGREPEARMLAAEAIMRS